MSDNTCLIKSALAAITLGLAVGCAQPASRLNSNAAAAAESQVSCSWQSCETTDAVAQAAVQPAARYDAIAQQAQPASMNANRNMRRDQEKVAKAFSVNRKQRASKNIEESTVIAGDFIITASVRALPEPNRFFTKVVIEEVDAAGDAQVIATPQLVSAFGQAGQISVDGMASGMAETNDSINVRVQIPNEDGDVDVQVLLNRNGQDMANSTVEVSLPR